MSVPYDVAEQKIDEETLFLFSRGEEDDEDQSGKRSQASVV